MTFDHIPHACELAKHDKKDALGVLFCDQLANVRQGIIENMEQGFRWFKLKDHRIRVRYDRNPGSQVCRFSRDVVSPIRNELRDKGYWVQISGGLHDVWWSKDSTKSEYETQVNLTIRWRVEEPQRTVIQKLFGANCWTPPKERAEA